MNSSHNLHPCTATHHSHRHASPVSGSPLRRAGRAVDSSTRCGFFCPMTASPSSSRCGAACLASRSSADRGACRTEHTTSGMKRPGNTPPARLPLLLLPRQGNDRQSADVCTGASARMAAIACYSSLEGCRRVMARTYTSATLVCACTHEEALGGLAIAGAPGPTSQRAQGGADPSQIPRNISPCSPEACGPPPSPWWLWELLVCNP